MVKNVVVCDLDDTLFLEHDFVYSGLKAVENWLKQLESIKIDNFFEKSWNLHLAGNQGKVFDRLLELEGVDKKSHLVEQMVSVYRNHFPNLKLLPDARRLLESGLVYGVITNGISEIQIRKVKALNLQPLVSKIVYCRDLGVQKPHPLPYRHMMDCYHESFGISPKVNFIYVGDHAIKDFSGARANGWKTVRIKHEKGLHTHVVGGIEDADLIVNSLDEVIKLFH